MKKLPSFHIGLAVVMAASVLTSCGGSTNSTSHTKNSVLAGGPCVSITANDPAAWEQDVEMTFCNGAATYSTDGGATKVPVPDSKMFPIAIGQWPPREGKISKIGVLSYDADGILVGDDVVTSTSIENCADGGSCRTGETGPNGGTVISVDDSTYIEIEAGNSQPSPLISQTEATTAATELSKPWAIPTVAQLVAILTATETAYDTDNQSTLNSHLSDHRFIAAEEPGPCTFVDPSKPRTEQYYRQSYCYFHPYWTKDSDTNRTAPNTAVTQEVSSKIGNEIRTVAYKKYFNSYCDINADANKNCAATILPIHEYKPLQNQRTVEVSQVDRDRWQEHCTETPSVKIVGNLADEDTSFVVAHPCITGASKEHTVIVHLNVWGTNKDGSQQDFVSKEITADPQNSALWTVSAPQDLYKLTYKLPIGVYQAKAWIEFEQVGDLRTSTPRLVNFSMSSQNQLDCTSDKLEITGQKLTLNCDGIETIEFQGQSVIENVAIVNKNTIEIPESLTGWFYLRLIYVIDPDTYQRYDLYACVTQCKSPVSKYISAKTPDDDNVMITTDYVSCDVGLTTLRGLILAKPNQNLYIIKHGNPIILHEKESLLLRTVSAYLYSIYPCPNASTEVQEEGVVIVPEPFQTTTENSPQPTTLNSSTTTVMEDASSSVPSTDNMTTPTTVEPAARIQVIGLLDPSTPVVELPQTDTTMVISAKELTDVATVEVQIDGITQSYSSTSGDITIPIARTASKVEITTVSTSGVKEVFTKVVSRPTQLASVDQVVTSNSDTSSSSSNNSLLFILGGIILLLILLFLFNKFSTSKDSES